MKLKIFTSIAFTLLSALYLKAQPTITSANMYAAGDVLTMQNADTAGINEGPAGANQTWGFSNLTASGSQYSQSVVAASGTTYASSFPTADLAIDAGGSFSYFDISGSDFLQLGFAASGIVAAYSDPQKVVSFPFTYNTSFSDNLAATYELNGFTNNRTGTVTFLADGYGKLVLPQQTFNDVLRIKYTENTSDVISIGPINITTTTVITTYYWMMPGNKNALLSISEIAVTSAGNTVHEKSVSYWPEVVSAGLLTDQVADIQLFPNPTHDYLQFTATLTQQGSARLSICNVAGQTVKVLDDYAVSPGLFRQALDMGDLESGLYHIKLDVNGRQVAAKAFIKE
ncbi:MAG: T9SS type A sorting domain-containing protein [Chitinophagales bacterium]|nr:T9SS type A sorting domain-containing protein [Chitinophagales bacterium]